MYVLLRGGDIYRSSYSGPFVNTRTLVGVSVLGSTRVVGFRGTMGDRRSGRGVDPWHLHKGQGYQNGKGLAVHLP